MSPHTSSMHETPGRVLVVEDERSIRELVAQQLTRAGYSCQAVADGADGRKSTASKTQAIRDAAGKVAENVDDKF